MNNIPFVSIIFVHFNTPDYLVNAIYSLKDALREYSYEIIVVDNNSDKKLDFHWVKKQKLKYIQNKKNYGYSKALNIGASFAKGKFLLFSNSDVKYTSHSIDYLINRLKNNKKIGLIGPQLIDNKNKIINTGSELPNTINSLIVYSFINSLLPNNIVSKNFWKKNINRNHSQEIASIGGAVMMIPRIVFLRLNGFDERFFLYFEEIDIARRVKELGLTVFYESKSKVIHFQSISIKNKNKIRHEFEKSRLLYFKKNYSFIGIVIEILLRISTSDVFYTFPILLISFFLFFYKIDSLMPIIGDIGRDYLAARDMIFTGTIPLLGIPTSVVWLHQGPLSIYFIAFSFIFSNFNPIAPAVFYGILGIFSTFLIYKIATEFFNKRVGIFSSLLFATSPIVLINTRMPYHTSPIPLFSALFFLFLFRFIEKRKNFIFLCFILGVNILFELSNIILLLVLLIAFYIKKISLSKKEVIYGICSFFFGIAPFIIYDLTHNFIQLGGLFLWIINRFRLFLGITTSDNATFFQIPDAIQMVILQITGFLFPWNIYFFLILLFIIMFLNKFTFSKLFNETKFLLLLLWIFVPISTFIIHTKPGPAYFPVIYPGLAMIFGYLFHKIINSHKYFIFIFIFIITLNSILTISHNFFLTTSLTNKGLPPFNYRFGFSFEIIEKVVTFIITDANGKAFTLHAGGFIKNIPTAIDPYKYLIWYYRGKIIDNSDIIYTIYQDKNEINFKEKVVYHNCCIYVTKYEKN